MAEMRDHETTASIDAIHARAASLAEKPTPDGSSCPATPGTSCDVFDWVYETSSVYPRMYGACGRCGNTYVVLLPRQVRTGSVLIDDAVQRRAIALAETRRDIVIDACETVFRRSGTAQRPWYIMSDRPIVLRRDVLLEVERNAVDRVRRFNRARETQLDELLKLVEERARQLLHAWSANSYRSLRGSAEKAQRALEALTVATRRERAVLKSLRDQISQVIEQARAARQPRLPGTITHATAVTPPGLALCASLQPEELIYGLVDPLELDVVRYVGKTSDPVGRYGHCTSGSDAVAAWVGALSAAGRSPLMLLIERCASKNVGTREACWIHHYRDQLQADLNRAIPPRPE
jgi:hypothetical protein